MNIVCQRDLPHVSNTHQASSGAVIVIVKLRVPSCEHEVTGKCLQKPGLQQLRFKNARQVSLLSHSCTS